jgi:hypothetical protein
LPEFSPHQRQPRRSCSQTALAEHNESAVVL